MSFALVKYILLFSQVVSNLSSNQVSSGLLDSCGLTHSRFTPILRISSRMSQNTARTSLARFKTGLWSASIQQLSITRSASSKIEMSRSSRPRPSTFAMLFITFSTDTNLSRIFLYNSLSYMQFWSLADSLISVINNSLSRYVISDIYLLASVSININSNTYNFSYNTYESSKLFKSAVMSLMTSVLLLYYFPLTT